MAGRTNQLTDWQAEFCEQLAARDLYVIRFDNRDVGLSTKFEEAGIPNLVSLLSDFNEGKPINPPYTLEDMADDGIGLLDALGIKKAHICGGSMGGMIVQLMAINYPNLILSLTIISSTTGNPDLPPPNPETLAAMAQPVPEGREAFIEYGVRNMRNMWGPGYPFDEVRTRKFCADVYDRSYYPQGGARQMVAIALASQNDRRSSLASVKIPTLVIHGDADPLVPVEGGIDLAETIPGAELLTIEGMGHLRPIEAWPQIIDRISALINRA